MIREIKLPRTLVSVPGDALKWSDDGQLALCSGPYATIMVPSIAKSREEPAKGDEQYDIARTDSIEINPDYAEQLPMATDEKFSMGASTTEHVITDLAWSPTGMSSRRGCLLAVLTSKNEAFVYEPCGNPGLNNWTVKYSLNQLLIEDLGVAGKQELSNYDFSKLRIHSIVWSRPVKGSTKWGTSFLLLGMETGHLIIYEVNPDVGIKLRYNWQVQESERWLCKMEMSQWTKINDAEDSIVYGSLLSIGDDTNRITVKYLTYDCNSSELQVKSSTNLLDASRFVLSTQSIYSDNSPSNINGTNGHSDGASLTVLAAHRTHNLHIWLFRKDECVLSKGVYTNFSSVASGIAIAPSENDASHIRLLTVSTRGEVFCALLDPSNGEVTEYVDNSIVSLVNKRRAVDSGSGEVDVIDFRSHGLIVHPHGSYMAMAYGVFQGKKLRFPIQSEQARRIAFLPLFTTNPRLPQPWPPTAGSSLCTWWEVRALTKNLPRSARDDYFKAIIDSANVQAASLVPVSERSSTGDLAKDLSNALLFDKSVDSIRLLDYYGITREGHFTILSLLASTTLRYVKENPGLRLGSLDRAILLAYNNVVEDSQLHYQDDSNEAGNIKLSGGFFEQEFDFKESAEQERIYSKSNNLPWQRCSITLLPLLTVDCLTCGGCFRKILAKSPLPDDKQSSLMDTIISTLDVCIFCGGRYYSRGQR